MEKQAKKKHTEKFKKEADRLALDSGKLKSTISRELGITTSLLYTWIKKYDEAKSRGLTVDEYKAEQDKKS